MSKRTAERETFLSDILITAVEGGINYWAAVSKYRHSDGHATATIHDEEDDESGPFKITIDSIARAFAILRKTTMHADGYLVTAEGKRLFLHPTYVRDYLEAYRLNDAGELDAVAADNLVQLACFGVVVYG